MESTPKSRGKERTQKQNTKHPPKKDLPTNDSALGDDAPTISGQDQKGHKEGLARTVILTPPTHLPKAGETTRQMEGPLIPQFMWRSLTSNSTMRGWKGVLNKLITTH